MAEATVGDTIKKKTEEYMSTYRDLVDDPQFSEKASGIVLGATFMQVFIAEKVNENVTSQIMEGK